MTFSPPVLKVEVCFDTDPFPTYYDSVGRLANGYWRLDEASGNFADSSGNSYTATATGGGFTYGVTGALAGDTDKACTFGTSSYATTTITAGSNLALGFSIEAWVKRSTIPSSAGVVAGIRGLLDLQILNASGFPYFEFVSSGAVTNSVTGNVNVCDGAWHHIVCAWNTAELRIWVDGNLACTPVAAVNPPVTTVTNHFSIGAFDDGTRKLGSVTLDEVAFYLLGLTQTQAQNHYIANAVNVSPTWVDITNDVMSVSISRGRQWERGTVEAGTASIVLDNTSRNYDPSNAASIYSPNVIPLRRIRVSATYSGTQYWLFTGYVERWPQAWENPDWAQTEITAVDGFEVLTQAGLDGYLVQTQAADGIWHPPLTSMPEGQVSRCLDLAGWPQSTRNIGTGAFSYGTSFTMAAQAFPYDGSTQALSYIQEIEQSEGGLFFIEANGYATFQSHGWRGNATSSTTSQGTFGDADDESELLYTELVPSYDKDRIVNDMRVTLDQGTYGPGDPTVYTSQDFTSIRKFLRRTDALSSHLYNASDATTRASNTTTLYATPKLRFDSMTIKPLLSDGLWLQAFNRTLSDRITVKRTPPGGGARISQDCWIEHVQWTIPEPGEPWQLTWMLSPAS